ncbi:MAG: hypothetical protein AAFR67_13465 [Chloroflexota bacterium]
MTQHPDMSEMDEYYERTRKPLFTLPDSPAGRAGCGALIALWFVVMLLPLAMMWLAFGNALTIPQPNAPEPDQQPRFQIELIMSIDNRGLKFTSSQVAQSADTTLCMESDTSYALWQSDDTATPATYCQCYTRQTTEDDWQFDRQLESACDTEE